MFNVNETAADCNEAYDLARAERECENAQRLADEAAYAEWAARVDRDRDENLRGSAAEETHRVRVTSRANTSARIAAYNATVLDLVIGAMTR